MGRPRTTVSIVFHPLAGRLAWPIMCLIVAWAFSCSALAQELRPTSALSAQSVQVLQAGPTQLRPSAASPAPEAAGRSLSAVGPGDQLTITVYGHNDMGAEVTVNDNGQITLPLVGHLRVTGMTPPAIEQLVAQRLRDGEYLKAPEVSVQVRQLRSQAFSVLGEVQRPGRYALQGPWTVLEALASAGGMTQKADRTIMILRRSMDTPGAARQEILVELEPSGAPNRQRMDLELQNDDVVYVGPQKLFYVHGEVRKPGSYPIEPQLNVMRVLSIAGGISERGSMRRISIFRRTPDMAMQKLSATLESSIEPGDVVFIDERLF